FLCRIFDGTTGPSSTVCRSGYFLRPRRKGPKGVPAYSTTWVPSTTPKRTLPPALKRTMRISAEPEPVRHGVEPRARAGDEAGGPEGAPRVIIPVVGAMGELEALAEGAEGHRVVAHHVTRAQREDADLLLGPLPGQPVAPVSRRAAEVPPQRLRHHLRHPQRGAAGRVLLEPMVDLGDLHVELVTDHARHVAQHAEGDVHRHAHIG